MLPNPSKTARVRTARGRAARQRLRRITPWAGLLAFLAATGIGFDSITHPSLRSEWVVYGLPDFSAYEDAGVRKQAFIAFLAPQVEEINERILQQRQRLFTIWQNETEEGSLPEPDQRFLRHLGKEYRYEWPSQPQEADFQALAERVDAIPYSLAIAQAALETGWGTSSLARQDNNLYGMLCYDPGCGTMPTNRPPHLPYYEYATYHSPSASLRAYIRNLNSNPVYQELRDIRAQLREAGREMTGHALAAGLEGYSDEGDLYITKVRDIIRQNQLDADPDYLARNSGEPEIPPPS